MKDIVLDDWEQMRRERNSKWDEIDLQARKVGHLQRIYDTPGYRIELIGYFLIAMLILLAFLMGVSVGMA